MRPYANDNQVLPLSYPLGKYDPTRGNQKVMLHENGSQSAEIVDEELLEEEPPPSAA